MQPSGLVFLVIIAIWATYLLQHWVRRREHLATARSIDRFSDAMRVLERRIPQPAFDMAALQAQSYAVSPARPVRPAHPTRPAFGANGAQDPRANVSMRHAVGVGAPRGSHASARLSARRLRGLSLLVSLSLAVAISTLAVRSVLPWWGPVLVLAAVMTDLVWLRHAAVSKRATRRADASADRAMAAVRRTATPARSTARSTSRSGAQPAARSSIRPEPMTAAPAAGATERAATTAITVQPAAIDRSSWEPVPVPPPTYTLKAKAERPEPVPAGVTEPPRTQASSFDGLVDDDELDGVLDRRAAGA